MRSEGTRIPAPLVISLLLFVFAAACRRTEESEAAARGRAVYMTHCTSCHNMNPSLPGSLGPAIQGASSELLEARVLRAEYPTGYRPKMMTRLMPARPDLAPYIDDLAAFLQ